MVDQEVMNARNSILSSVHVVGTSDVPAHSLVARPDGDDEYGLPVRRVAVFPSLAPHATFALLVFLAVPSPWRYLLLRMVLDLAPKAQMYLSAAPLRVAESYFAAV